MRNFKARCLPERTQSKSRASGLTFFKQMSLNMNFVSVKQMQHGDGVLVWGCLAAAGPGQFNILESTTKPTPDPKLLEERVNPSMKKFTFKWI